MRVCIVDVYNERPFRVSKDTNGGFGTGNEFGYGLVPKFLTRLKKRSVDFPALSVAYMAAALERNGHEVKYVRNATPPKDTDLVLLPSSIVEHSKELQFGARLKKAGFRVGYTGPFASARKEDYLQAGDFVVDGEPEFLFLEDPSLDDLAGVVVVESDRSIDELPFPNWNIFSLGHLRHALIAGKGRFFPVLASRGCPHACSFYCTYPLQQGKRVRQRTPENVVDEMEWLHREYGAEFIMFRDPIFGINRQWTLEFAKELIRRRLQPDFPVQMEFAIETHLNCLNEEVIDWLYRAGLRTVKTGVENSDKNIMVEFSRKSVKMDRNQEVIKYLEGKGIKVFAFYIFAMPEDDHDSCMRTIKYAKKLNTYGAQFSVATPYPGTPWYEEMKDSITAARFDDFSQFRLVWKHPHLSSDDVERIKSHAYTSYYLRSAWIGKQALFKLKRKLGRFDSPPPSGSEPREAPTSLKIASSK